MTPDGESRSGTVSIYLALVNAALTAIVLASPIGTGDGNDMIGFSVYRMIIMICPQGFIAVAGLIAAFRAMTKKQGFVSALFLNMVVMLATFFLYFAQSQTIERFF